MESLGPQVVVAAKLPILNPNEFDLWKIRTEHYFLMTDYSLCKVILNGDSPTPTRVVDGVVQVIAPIATEQRLAKKNELKAIGTLLMALPDKHQLKFNIHKDAKSLMEAIEKRFGGNKETKKVQKTLLKQHLPSEWRTHTLIWRNKADMEDQSLDDLFNNLKIYEAEVKSSSATSHNTQNIAFVSLQNTDNTNDDVVIYSFFASQSNSLQLNNEDLKQIDADDLEEMDLKWQMAMLTMRARRFLQSTGRNLGANGTTAIGFDMSKADEEPINYALMAFTSSSSSSSSGSDNENENVFEEDIKPLKLNVMLRDNALVELRKKFEKAKKERDELKHTLEKFQTSLKNLSKLLESQITDKTGLGYDNQVFNSTVFDCNELNSSKSDESVPTSLVHDSETVPNVFNVEPSTTKPTKELSQSNRPSAPIIEDWVSDSEDEFEAVLTRFRLVLLNAARPVTTVVPQTTVKNQRSVKHVVNKAHSLIRRPIHHRPAHKHRNFYKTVTAVKVNKVNTVKGTKGNWGNPQQALKDKGVIDSGCSRHMTGNISYLSDFKEITWRICCIWWESKRWVPRENNMYNVDLKNVVPLGDLTCLFAKATLDESNLWHRRLGHINFKTMNKLVKGNLVRGLPSKVFENNHTCVTCKKGKQHRASWNQPNHNAGIQGNFDVGKVVKEAVSAQQYVLLPLWSTGSQNPQNTDIDVAFNVKENEFEVHVSPSSSDKPNKHDEKTNREAKGKNPIDLSTRVRNLRDEFEEFSVNNTNRVNVATAPVTAVGPNSTNSTNSFNVANMPALKDIVYSDDEEDVGAEADFSNLETNKEYGKDGKRTRGKIDQTLSIKKQKDGNLLVQVYVDDIIFGSTNKELCKAFEKLMKDKFQMSLMGELAFFLGLQVKQKDDRIFISQDKYVADILRKFGLTGGKSASTPIDTEKPLLKDPDGEDVDLHIYSDYAGASLDRKSTTGDCQFLGCRLIDWQCKKQIVVATSSTKAEYVAAASCCA
uniref:Copia protein n=1 Tax=Tanacetum cinerariifolium TaxID=118510 RepID=A0A6L2J731_TANCI|nr:copia protein [Tanacetum cinerariifolium]